ncbi:putative Trafficking protein particle complex subunit 6B [Hypsibius exemplaris]|uniref:Trafficking protein particle complex subunit 6B n=1 Tax=Hypsibius exemplaris TaxID=2072580 RepID=A0A9X6N9I4_HYPEX|nr:putative Trafficking protein particle complex subunit 6B [Hypsibius exemplaris]
MADAISGPSYLYNLLANELSVALYGDLDKTSENMGALTMMTIKDRKAAAAAAGPSSSEAPVDTSASARDSDTVFPKLESIGYQVGQRLIERLTKEHARFKDELDRMKFVCTDLWKYLYDKQIDTLRTNNQGTYVFTDNLFRPLAFFSAEGVDQYYPQSGRFIAFPCGIIRGALSALGIRCTVSAKVLSVTCCVFEVVVERT